MTRPSLGHLPFTQGPTTSQLDPRGHAGPKASGRLASGVWAQAYSYQLFKRCAKGFAHDVGSVWTRTNS